MLQNIFEGTYSRRTENRTFFQALYNKNSLGWKVHQKIDYFNLRISDFQPLHKIAAYKEVEG